MGRFVIVAYTPKPAKEEALIRLLRKHLQVLLECDLVTNRAAYVMKSQEGIILEVFEWKSAEAISLAHHDPRVTALWSEFSEVCDYKPLSGLQECQQMFAEFDSIEL